MADYKDTSIFPTPRFPMRGDLPRREPQWVGEWQEKALYQKIARAVGRPPRFVPTTDRPTPTATSTSATRSTKILKDIIVRSKTLAGFDAPTSRAGTATVCPSSTRSKAARQGHPRRQGARPLPRLCRRAGRAAEGLHPPGRAGRMDKPYLTMAFKAEADEIRALGGSWSGLPLPGPEAGELVPGLRFGPGRGRGGIRGQGLAGHRRRFSRS